MVLDVCRRVLGNATDAEDAFQATFLILVRKAAALRERCAVLGGWLHEVAYNTALRARAKRSSRHLHEQKAAPRRRSDFIAAVVWRDLRPVLDEEVRRLPQRYRAPFVLCYLEGKTYAQAARQLQCRSGTISHQLARARELLRLRLTRRGLTLSAAALAALLAQNRAVAVPGLLVDATVKAALAFAAGKTGAAGAASTPAAALAEGAFTPMFATRIKLAALIVLALGLLGLGVATARPRGAAGSDPAPVAGQKAGRPKAPTPGANPPKAAADQKDEAKSMTFTGQVKDQAGKPPPKADLAVLGLRIPTRPNQGYGQEILVTGKADAQGKFRLKANAPPGQFDRVQVVAWARGHGLLWEHFSVPSREHKVPDLQLPGEQTITGRLFDLQGNPAANARCRVTLVMDDRALRRMAREWQMKMSQFAASFVDQKRRETGLSFTDEPAPKGIPFWPREVTTDAQGRFKVRGFGGGQAIDLLVEHKSFALHKLTLEAARPGQKEFTKTLAAPQVFEGEVLAADTGKPVPKAWVSIEAVKVSGRLILDWGKETGLFTDANGRFRINPYSGDFFHVRVQVKSQAPYLGTEFRVDWPKGASKHKLPIKLARGVLVRGKVVEKKADKPVDWVRAYFQPQQQNNPTLPANLPYAALYPAISDRDGSFQLVVPAGPGHLLASVGEAPGRSNVPAPANWFADRGRGKDFVLSSVGSGQLQSGQPGGFRRYFHAILPLNLKPQAGPKKLTLTVRRGVTLKGKVVGPDGKAVPAGILFGPGELFQPPPAIVPSTKPIAEPPGSWNIPSAALLKDGRFELSGCDPDRTYRVSVLGFPKENKLLPVGLIRGNTVGRILSQEVGNGKNCLGAAVEISARKAAGKPLTIKLAPCGSARTRLVDEKGKLVQVQYAWLELVVSPRQGPAKLAVSAEAVPIAPPNPPYLVGASAAAVPMNKEPFQKNPLKFVGLIPGATYRIVVLDDRTLVKKEFTIKSGKETKVPDIVMARP
jgi:RNA polymerase sigma factor (sigma-70 family)